MFSQTAAPSFLLLLALVSVAEFIWRRASGAKYDLKALGGTLGVAIGQNISKVLTASLITGAFLLAHQAAPINWPMDDWRSWALGFVAVEFAYYWQHRFSHTIRWLWATHAVHHSPNEFILPAAIRLGWTGAISGGWMCFLPLAALGMPPLMISALLAANLQFQFFLHTEAVGKLGILELFFNTPSHHRVHHGSNAEYLDKNFGGVLIIFDRLFGTFAEELSDAPVIYGLTKPLETSNPFAIAFHEWRRMFEDAVNSRSVDELLRALFGRPGVVTSTALIGRRQEPMSVSPKQALE
ncbi:MAG: sterol desaturase family protein [Alphaproteobacteria bacterium]|nr:sterol desaturase family protein [Alphaproteobacteria bacterium]